jgi:hypothetical protein
MTSVFPSTKKVPLSLRFILFNIGTLGYLYFTDRLKSDWLSVISVIAALIVMNFVCWISSRNYKEWK